MIITVKNEAPWQILSNAMTISPSSTGYDLQVSANGKDYSTLFSVGAGITRQVTNLSSGSYFRMLGNIGEVVVNWVRDCSGGGGTGGNAGELEPVTDFPVGAPAGTVVALSSGGTVGVYQYDGTDWAPIGGGDMSNYYTKAETDAAITGATQGFVTEAYVTGATEEIYETMETKEEVVASALTELHNQVLEISGSTGGGNIVELTKAQYEALDPPEEDTLYIITDADAVDLDDYAQTSAVTQLVQGKADKQNVTARASGNYWPRWNNQGVITGEDTYYTRSNQVNGRGFYTVDPVGYDAIDIYAPTSAGTAGQPLLSNGSGAPVWGGYKFAFITQTQYDALTTPDSTTIYFIIGD